MASPWAMLLLPRVLDMLKLFMAMLVPLWGLDGMWLLHFVAGVFSAAAAILIVRRVRLQAPPSAPPVASFFQPPLSFNYRRKTHI